MMKKSERYQEELFVRIVTAIQQSGHLTKEVIDYIESALFPPDPEPLADFLTDDTDCERDTLLDLIFSPNATVQMDLEPLLEAFAFSPENENALRRRLISTDVAAPMRMPDNRQLGILSVPGDIKSHYLTRTNITWQLEPGVRSSIEKSVSPGLWPVIKVKLRNKGIRFLPHHLTFWGRFFERMADNDPGYLDCLDVALSLLEATGNQKSVYELFAERKRSLFRSLQQINRFVTLLRRSNMETLMLQGVRAPHASRRELIEKMTVIDRICYCVFGKTEIIAEPVEEQLLQVSDPTDPEATVRSLLR